VERILLAMPEADAEPLVDVFVIAFDDDSVATSHRFVRELRAAGVRALTQAYDGRSKRAQSKAAQRSQAPWQLVVGPDEIAADRYTLKRMSDGHEESVGGGELAAIAARLIGAAPAD
jgi:histidyl-tRNA synthetase